VIPQNLDTKVQVCSVEASTQACQLLSEGSIAEQARRLICLVHDLPLLGPSIKPCSAEGHGREGGVRTCSGRRKIDGHGFLSGQTRLDIVSRRTCSPHREEGDSRQECIPR